MRRWPAVAVIGLALALAAANAALAQPAFVGVWSGNGRQTPGNSTWSVVMLLNGDRGRIDYPSLRCGGSLALTSRQGNEATYRETITYGRGVCVDDEIVTVRIFNYGQADETIAWTVTGEHNGERYSGVASLRRIR